MFGKFQNHIAKYKDKTNNKVANMMCLEVLEYRIVAIKWLPLS